MKWNDFKAIRPRESCQIMVEFTSGEKVPANVFIDDESEIYTLPEGKQKGDIIKWALI